MALTEETTVVHSKSIGPDSDSSSAGDGFYRAARDGEVADISSDQTIEGFDAERMRARTSLTTEEERKLLRRIDWHLMPLCSFMFLFKNLDVDNVSTSQSAMQCSLANPCGKVSNARIMNRGTPQNILTQLNLTSDQFALVTVLYYVSSTSQSYIKLCADSNVVRFRMLLVRHLQICY
jgi:hypothetical protein